MIFLSRLLLLFAMFLKDNTHFLGEKLQKSLLLGV